MGVGASIVAGVIFFRWRRSLTWGYCHLRTRLDGKVVLITGANTGLGRRAALNLAARGATLILACRDVAKAEAVALEIQRRQTSFFLRPFVKKKLDRSCVHCVELDLGSLASVQQCAQKVDKMFPQLDCVVCNAGAWV